MKRSKSYLLQSVAAVLLSCAGLVSCSKDDIASAQGGDLPAGEYPLTLTASVEGMTTRADGKDTWTVGDEIGVRMGTADTYAKYVIGNTEGTSVSPAGDDQTLYWQNSDPVTITSWYPYEAQTDVDITNQSSGFAAFDYLTATEEGQFYENTVELKFRHQMAKVSYTLIAGDGISADDIASATVLFAGYTTASFSEGALTTSETENGWITPTSEKDVLLVPQNMTDQQFIKVRINDGSYIFTPTIGTDANLNAGYHYTYNITVSATGLEVTASSSIAWGTGTDGSGTVYIGDDYAYSDANNVRTFTVYTEAGLQAWRAYTHDEQHWGTNCTLANDITLTEPDSGKSNWAAVGYSTRPYTGTFDGNGHTITNLTINTLAIYQGLIAALGSGGVVKNLTLEEVSIYSSNSYIGAVVGYNYYGTVTNCCFASGSVTGSGDGSGTVTDSWYIGGIVGYNNYGTITGCFAMGTVKGSNWTGGVAGCNNNGNITGCCLTGTVTPGNRNATATGGVVGYNGRGDITACYVTGSVGGYYYTGGVVGYNLGNITACYATGTLTGYRTTGGVAGVNNTNITACYWKYNSSDIDGIGSEQSDNPESSNDNATKVDGTDVTWTDAKDAMNTALTGSGWQYTGDGTSDPPLTLVKE